MKGGNLSQLNDYAVSHPACGECKHCGIREKYQGKLYLSAIFSSGYKNVGLRWVARCTRVFVIRLSQDSKDGCCLVWDQLCLNEWDHDRSAVSISGRAAGEREIQNSSDLMSPLEKDERNGERGGRSVEVFPAGQVEWVVFLAFQNTFGFPHTGLDRRDRTSKTAMGINQDSSLHYLNTSKRLESWH